MFNKYVSLLGTNNDNKQWVSINPSIEHACKQASNPNDMPKINIKIKVPGLGTLAAPCLLISFTLVNSPFPCTSQRAVFSCKFIPLPGWPLFSLLFSWSFLFFNRFHRFTEKALILPHKQAYFVIGNQKAFVGCRVARPFDS